MSNCFIAAVLFKISNWNTTSIYVNIPNKITLNSLPHFYWRNNTTDTYYHYSPHNHDLPGYRLIWFKGSVKRYSLRFNNNRKTYKVL